MADPLETLARKAQEEPFFLAHVLAAYARSEGLDDTGLAGHLGCPVGELPMLRLCRTPGTEPGAFREDVSCIAERFGIAPQTLAEAVKRGRVVIRLQTGPSPGGLLMAARDHPTETPPEEP